MDLLKLVTELKQLDAQQLATVEIIKALVRRSGTSITSNMTRCNKNNCLVCKLGFCHGFYFIITLNGRRVRVRRKELPNFLSRFVPENVIETFLRIRQQRHVLLKRINSIIRWQEQETRNIHTLLKYSITPVQLATVFQNPQTRTPGCDVMDKLARKGSEFLYLLLDRGTDALVRWLNGSNAKSHNGGYTDGGYTDGGRQNQ